MLSPMVERELRVGLLRRKAREHWVRAATLAGGITVFFMLFMALGSSSSPGRTLFRFLFVLACAGVVTRGFGLTADLFSEERRNGTLGLLVLTGLTPLEIFFNKLFGAALLVSYGLLGSLPFFAIPFLAGGVSAAQFLCAVIFLVNALFFCVAIGLLASVLHRDGGQAQVTALASIALLSLAAPIALWISIAVLGRAAASHSWLVSSPIYPGYLAFTGFTGGAPRQFWTASSITLCYSVCALLLAAVVLQFTWRDEPDAQGRFRGSWRAWVTSARLSRRRLRERLLAQSPFAWVAARNRGPALVAQIFIAIFALVSMGLFSIAGLNRLTFGNILFASVLVHLGLNWIVAYAAGKRFADERMSGGFEVLFTTPVSVQEIVEGQSQGLIVQFKTTWCMVTTFDLLLASSNFLHGSWDMPKVMIYSIMWSMLLLLWFAVHVETAARAMWISAWTGRPGYAAVHAMRANIWTLFWLWFLSQPFRRNLPFETGGMAIFLLVIVGITFGAFGSRGNLRDKLVRELRDIACAPIPARGDKRFKKWDAKRIFPPGRWGYFDLRPLDPVGTRRLN